MSGSSQGYQPASAGWFLNVSTRAVMAARLPLEIIESSRVMKVLRPCALIASMYCWICVSFSHRMDGPWMCEKRVRNGSSSVARSNAPVSSQPGTPTSPTWIPPEPGGTQGVAGSALKTKSPLPPVRPPPSVDDTLQWYRAFGVSPPSASEWLATSVPLDADDP